MDNDKVRAEALAREGGTPPDKFTPHYPFGSFTTYYLASEVEAARVRWREALDQMKKELVVAKERRANDARRLRQQHPCVICEWPRPADNEHNICECCGFQEGYDYPERYQWDGTWWATDERQPKILAEAESQRAALTQELRAWEEREAACCPEDVGFEEYIASLKRRLSPLPSPPTEAT